MKLQMGINERILRLEDNFAVINKLCGGALEGAGKGRADLSQILAEALEAPPVMDGLWEAFIGAWNSRFKPPV
jgi:hypothetical protein